MRQYGWLSSFEETRVSDANWPSLYLVRSNLRGKFVTQNPSIALNTIVPIPPRIALLFVLESLDKKVRQFVLVLIEAHPKQRIGASTGSVATSKCGEFC